jgi:hypothetical protein
MRCFFITTNQYIYPILFHPVAVGKSSITVKLARHTALHIYSTPKLKNVSFIQNNSEC